MVLLPVLKENPWSKLDARCLMKRVMLVCAVVAAAGLSRASPRAQAVVNEPGMPTIARVYVLNRDRSEAIPVTVHPAAGEPFPVALSPAATVSLAADTAVFARAGRQTWEYRQISGTGDQINALNEAGADGWEAVGAVPTPGRTTWLLKRPR
jgi:hypothetical protein